ncbi:protein kinase subdomain-containing protein [Colletotrichum asianum]|uniref:Protein kinase subdomain-containing protein n=1 Tax=Colletotrichum asianum TaxID=702518 RepID=A0A8H3W944_9PEZI|nr:protein kinase subdomain-containing protein [Colletotrichum asianum]
MSHVSRHPLRKSCTFCRARKIKCSNETICEACRKQNVDCVYDWDSRPTKPRPISRDGSRRNSNADGTISVPVMRRQRSSTAGSSRSTLFLENPTFSAENAMVSSDCEDVATVLEEIFQANFGEDLGLGTKPEFQGNDATFSHALQRNPSGQGGNSNSKSFQRDPKFTSILHFLAHDLVSLVVDKVGSLGSTFLEHGGGRFYSSTLASDTTPTMFDATLPGPSPLSEYGTRQIGQLVDVWYSAQPLSFLVSKTLLLRALRDSAHNEILLAVILADASMSLGDEIAVGKAHTLFSWAASQLHNRPLPTVATHPGMPGDGVSLPSLSTAQTLMLLGWNALCQKQIRCATCYIDLAGRIATEIKERISTSGGFLVTSRINGIDVCEVEKEIAAYLYWTTYALNLWISLQTRTLVSQLQPTSAASILLPADESSSALMRLDEISDNFSTLQKQKEMIKDIWPLAHVASTAAYIFNTYLETGSPENASAVCHEAYRVLAENIFVVNLQPAPASSRYFVLAMYHTMSIHLLFPSTGASPPTNSLLLHDAAVESFLLSAQESASIMLQSGEHEEPVLSSLPIQNRRNIPDIFCPTMDACARGLSFLYARKASGAYAMNPQMDAYDIRLEALASRLVDIAASDFVFGGSQLRVIKKHLKAVLRAFGGDFSTPSNGDRLLSLSPMPIRPHSATSSTICSRRNSFMSHSPPSEYISAAPTAVGSARSSMIGAMSAPMIPTSSAESYQTPFPSFSSPEARPQEWNNYFTPSMNTATLTQPSADLSLTGMMNPQAAFPGEWDTNHVGMSADVGMESVRMQAHWQWQLGAVSLPPEAVTAGGDVDDMFYYFNR